jgi:hypothetical protein
MYSGAGRTCPFYVFDSDMEANANMRRGVKDGLVREIVVTIQRVLNLLEMFMRAGQVVRNEETFKVRFVALGVDSPCVTTWLPFYLDDNMGSERDVILHPPVTEVEQIRDANLPSLHFPLLFPHGELRCHLAVR